METINQRKSKPEGKGNGAKSKDMYFQTRWVEKGRIYLLPEAAIKSHKMCDTQF